MAVVSSTVNSGELATATQYNNLRTDAVGSTGHDHGSGQGNVTISATTFDGTATVSGAWNFTGAVGIDSSVDADVTDFDLASSGDIDLVSTNDAASAIYLRENAGTSGTIKIHADQGTSESSIQLLSDAGGVDINAATGKDVDIAGGTVNLTSSDNAASAIYLRANAGTSETIKIHADQGTGTGSIELLSDAGGIELDAGTDIILDAGGADIFLKDDGTLFGTLNNNSGELLIKSSSSGTTAATFTGANVVFAGTVDATTDFTIGTTVITDDSIVMTPSSSDTVTIAGATHGILNVTTVDAAGTAADVNIDADGEIVIDAADAAGTIFKIAGTAQVNVIDGGIVPETTNDIDLGTSSLEFKDAWFDGTVTADAFAGPLTGNVTGNASGTAATVTGGTQASITTVANVVEVGALNAGSITSGFGTIDTGSSNITTTGTVSAEQLTTTDDLALSSSGAVINFNSGNITLTHADDELVLKSGAGNTLLGIDAAGSGESQLKFRNQGVNKFQLVLVPGSHISLYDHVGGNESFRMYENSDNLQMVSGDIDMNSAGGVLNVGASGNDWTATLLALQNTALLKIGATTAHGTTAGTNLISLFNGTAPAGTLTNGASFFCASGEMKVIDAAGNITVLSPHDDDGQWVFHSRDSTTGRVLHIKMEQLMRRLDEELGGGFIEEFIER